MNTVLRNVLLPFPISLAFAFSAHAATQVVPFNSAVEATCVITLDSPGVMAADGLSKLDSAVAGGSAGRVTILTTGDSFNVTAAAPSVFTQAPDGVGAATFLANYSATGATDLADIPGATPSPLGLGSTALAVNLSAETSGEVFPAGQYQADVTVTCE